MVRMIKHQFTPLTMLTMLVLTFVEGKCLLLWGELFLISWKEILFSGVLCRLIQYSFACFSDQVHVQINKKLVIDLDLA